jgi:hypothetical protein
MPITFFSPEQPPYRPDGYPKNNRNDRDKQQIPRRIVIQYSGIQQFL